MTRAQVFELMVDAGIDALQEHDEYFDLGTERELVAAILHAALDAFDELTEHK